MDTQKTPKENHHKIRLGFSRKVGSKEDRKLRARQQKSHSIWFGLGLLGLVGWSVVLPTLLGMALGIWIDREFPSRFSWTLMLLFAGLMLGCLNAWQWVNREQTAIERFSSHKQSQEEVKDD
ncbi:AtpZ/AtpI family protein [Nostoc muscorum FACHB-395]|jgi:ATP synthase protein I|nr:AtpZ/AtpI family protein [Desmonostoc muscorum FACHB-395]